MVKIAHPPLKTFSLEINFNKMPNKSFKELAQLESEIDSIFSIEPQVNLLTRVGPNFELPIQINPLIFTSTDKLVNLTIFSDSIVIKLYQYDRWTSVKKNYISIIFKILKLFNITSIKTFRIDYDDEYEFSDKDFLIEKYFNLSFNTINDWPLDYRDFILGINLKINKLEKLIFRLKGVPSNDPNKIRVQLQSFYINQINDLKVENLTSELDKAHDELIKRFIMLHTDESKQIIGMVEELVL